MPLPNTPPQSGGIPKTLTPEQNAVAEFVQWAFMQSQKEGKSIIAFLDEIKKQESAPGEETGEPTGGGMSPKDMMKQKLMGKM